MTSENSTENVFQLLNNTVKELAVSRFSEPTVVQNLVIPKVLEGKNVLAIAGTGLGKTESVMLPLFSKLVEKEHKPIALIYITPLRALNRNMLDRLLWWSSKLELDASVRHGDTTQSERKLQLEYPPHILITTPEQIQAMLTGKRFKEHLRNVKYIVVDEIHEIVESKRGVQLTLALERLKRLCGIPQIIALSATVGSPDVAAKFIFSNEKYEIINAIQEKDLKIIVESPYPTKEDKALAEKIFIGDGVAARLRSIYEYILKHRSTLTFTNTREAAEILSSRLRLLDKEFPHGIHHSSLSKEVRLKAEKEFKEEKLKALITTSSLELGIDIGSIELVLQYMSPRQVSKLVQRIGRSGHGVGRVSEGIIISGEGDDIFESAVIARKALNGELEKLTTYENCLDVLAHQIIGLGMEEYGIDWKEIYKTFKNATPYRNLSEKEFLELIKFLDEQLHLLFTDNGVKRRRRAFPYYFENLSVIPDSQSYKIIDITTNTPVGSLDEEFIATHGDAGSSFIVKGRPWKIISIEKGKVYVEAVEDIESSIPAWEGELIPVPFEVAQEVGKLRSSIEKMNEQNLKQAVIVEKIKEKYPVSSHTASKMVQLIKLQMRKFPVPSNEAVLIEKFQDFTVLHSPFGSLANETLARFIAAILSAEYGEIIASKSDPYRIILRGTSAEDIKKIFVNYNPEDIEVILEKALQNSTLFKWRFINVAKRFGAISKGANFEKLKIERIIDVYKDSPIYKEILREIFTEKLDLESAKNVFRQIKDKKIRIEECEGLSPLAELGFRYELTDIARPDRPEKEIFKLFRKRLMDTKIRILCVNCGKYAVNFYVKEIDDEPRCRYCHSRLLAVLRPHLIEAQEIVKKRLAGKELTDEETKNLERIRRSADLVIVYGKKACIALAGRGVGPQTASRILARMHRNEDEFYKDILKAEREFIRTKKFWSD